MNFSRSIFSVALVGLVGAANAGTMWGTDLRGDLYKIDTTTAVATLVGNHGLNLESLAYNDASGILYGADSGGSLYTLDQTTAAGSLIGNTGMGNIEGLDFAGSFLYGFNFNNTPQIFDIDPSTAVATLYATSSLATGSVRTFAFNPSTSLALMATDLPSYQTLHSMDTVGTATALGSLGNEGVYGMDFIGNDLFGLGGGGQLWSIDQFTGSKALIGNTGGQFWLGAASMAAPVPEPATMVAVGLGLAGLARRRRSKKNSA